MGLDKNGGMPAMYSPYLAFVGEQVKVVALLSQAV